MGLQTEIAKIITGEPSKMEGGTDDLLHEMDIDKNMDDAEKVLDQIREVVEGEYNPFNEPECEEDSNRYSGFEVARQAILKAMGD